MTEEKQITKIEEKAPLGVPQNTELGGKEKPTKSHNEILTYVLITCAGIILLFLVGYFFIDFSNKFAYGGMDFNTLTEGNVKFYHTSFVIKNANKKIDYNVYIRNDPRELEKIPFTGSMNLKEMLVLNNSEDFTCDGDGGIAGYNLQQVLNAIGTTMIKDPEAGCDELGRYVYVQIQQGEITSVEQTGPACYVINVKDCEILKGTEKFLLETIIQANK